MKYTAALALGMVPAALGKSVHKVYPVRRDGGELEARNNGGASVTINGQAGVAASSSQIEELTRQLGLNKGSGIEINFLWVNLGGGAATTVLNAASTVTVTQTIGGAAAGTPPPAVATGGAEAGSATPPAAASGAASAVAGGQTHDVTVGGPQGLSYNPPEIKAAVGDTVRFTFLSQNHTATQSAFDKPCEPLAGGMDSGFQSNPNNTVNPPPQVAMQIMVSTPLWFYCRQNGHCGKGMAFSINPTAAKTQAMFQAMAIAQAGKGTGSAITGGAAAPAAAPPADAGAAQNVTNTVGGGAAVAAPTSVAGGTASNSGIVTGAGTLASDGSCLCAVSCAFQMFPAAQAQGVDAFGGVPGALPMNMAQAS
ncbi:hypothetical protein B0T26DRAFT_743978 [Lasiosphaeria miniovina]|uniref:Serine-threonine rich protein n=1 Tax=Lasiosphaeria miniovina TaxID=1954250 RepID=A0AA40A036_9PEZI|nr:uncharacterized protein B0T26DRAFT_743978 [Lasiosphaeria miniovina]KAK0706846.1 hypothetical protein B0T26DRAFT_743978 [Lasiosphaeria miniovina]